MSDRTKWTLVETKDEWWEVLDELGSQHSKHGSKEDALLAAANSADENEALAADLRAEADDAQEIADGLRAIIEREDEEVE